VFFFSSKMNDGTPIDVYRNASKEGIIKECEESLRNLGTDYIDLYQIHWPDPTTPIQETMEAVDQLVKEGKVRYAGVCNYSKEEMIEAERYITLISNQVKYSMLTRKIEDELVPHTIEKNKAILAYSPLERGLLTGKIKPDTKFGEGDNRGESSFYSADNIVKINGFLDEIKPIADDHHISITQLVIAWTLAQPGITVALVGARDAEQSTHNAKAAEITLNKGEIDIINDKLVSLTLE
jgi:aryl-alcohol dehydrogenase-like predicted oxidoreductase